MPEPAGKHFRLERITGKEEELLALCSCLNCGFSFSADLRRAKLEKLMEEHLEECPNKRPIPSAEG